MPGPRGAVAAARRHVRLLATVPVAALVAAAALTATAASAATGDTTRIAFLGDSITGGPGCWRAPVWVALTDAGLSVDMVGIREADECGGVRNAAGELWDPDHTGIGGITTSGMFVRIVQERLVEELAPDVVVVLLGTNDVWGGRDAPWVLGQYQLLLDAVRADAPGVSLVFGTLPAMGPEACPTCQEQIDTINAALPAWVDSATTRSAPVTLAVLHEGFDPATDTDDGVHPNAAGTAKLAAAWTPAVLAAVEERSRPEGAAATAWLAVAAGVTVATLLVGAVVARRRPRTRAAPAPYVD